MEIFDNDKLKNAGVLLFCNKVSKFFLNAVITCVLFLGNDKINILDRKEFEKIFDQAGETGIVSLSIEGEKENHPVIVKNIQKHPIDSLILHVDLRQVILTEKISAMIPVEMIGVSPAATQKLGILIQNVSEIEVEALPLDLPEKFIVDVSKLANVGDQISVKEMEIDRKKIELKVSEDLIVVKIEPLAAEEVAPTPVTPVEGEAPAEGTTSPVEGEAPAEEKPSSAKDTDGKKEEKKE